MNDRKEWIDYAKGIGIILVVYGHLLSNGYHDGLNIPEGFHELSRNILYSFHRPFFFLLAGLLVEKSLQKHGPREYVIDKLKKIAYPYFLWSAIQIIIEAMFSDHTQSETTLSNLFQIWYLPWGQFWFIYALFLMHISHAVLSSTGRLAKPIMLIMGVILFFNPLLTNIGSLYEFSIYFVYFVFGILLNKYFFMMERLEIRPIFILILFIVLVTCGVLIYGNFTHEDPYLQLFYKIYLSIVGIVFCISLAQYLARKTTLTFIRTFGLYSLPIYLVHMIAGAGTRLVLSHYLHIQNWVFLIFISVLIALVSPILLQRLSEKVGFPYFFELPWRQKSRLPEKTAAEST
jgi:fucose 4-O-acetylase-like acetyltransferase